MQTKDLQAKIKSIDNKNYTMDVYMSVEVPDRQNDVVDIDSLSYDDFLGNPSLLQFHDYYNLAVGKITKIWKGQLEDGTKTLEATIQFAYNEYDIAKTYWNLYANGYMSAFSIGFQVSSIQEVRDVNGNLQYTRLLGAKLLELSCVAVPANQLALAKKKGMDIQPIAKSEAFKTMMKELMIDIKSIVEDEKVENKEEDKTENKDESQEDNTSETTTDEKKEDTTKTYEDLKKQILIKSINKVIRGFKK